MIALSTGLVYAWLNSAGLRSILYGGYIDLYGGTRPASPDHPRASVIVATVTQNGLNWTPPPENTGGLLLDMRLPQFLEKSGNWVLNGRAGGVPTWGRWHGPTPDDGGFSIEALRLDFDVGDDFPLPDSLKQADGSYLIASSTLEQIPAFIVGLDSFFN